MVKQYPVRFGPKHHLRAFLCIPPLLMLFCVAAECAVTDLSTSEAAHAKFKSGDLAGAKVLFEQLLKGFPSSPKAPDAHLYLGRIKLKTNPDATQELLDAFSSVRKKYPSSPEAGDALVHIGFLHSRSDTGQAIKDFTEFVGSYPGRNDAARVHQTLGRLYLRNLDLDKAEAAFDKVKSITGASSSVADEAALQSGFVKIMRFYATKDKSQLTAAVDALSKLASSSRLNVRARADLGAAEAALLLGKSNEAYKRYRAAADTYGKLPYFHGIALYGAALSSEDTGRAGDAVKEYAELLAAQAGKTLAEKEAAWKSCALASTSQNAQVSVQRDGDWKRLPGVDIIRRAAYGQGRCLYLLAQYDDAISVLAELTQYLPESDDLRVQAAQLMERCKNAKGANQQ